MLRTPDVTASLSGKTLVQFSSGTPERAREAGQWARLPRRVVLNPPCRCPVALQIGNNLGTFFYTGTPGGL